MGNFGTRLISAAKRNNKKVKKVFDQVKQKSLSISAILKPTTENPSEAVSTSLFTK